MPLNKPALQTALEALSTTPGATIADCAHQWAQAMVKHFAAVVPPSTTVTAAAGALEASLVTAFAQPAAAPAMDAAFQTFAAAVGVGMVPFVAVPPPAPVLWATLLAPPYPETAAQAAQKVATRLDLWARTGSATPPLGAPVPWS